MNVERLLNWPFQDVVQTYTERDCILYALGVGLGLDPLDARQLRYLYEGAPLAALPTLPVVLCHPGPWTSDPATGIVRSRQVHGEQGIEIHGSLSASGRIRGRTRVTGIVDKGAGRGALLYSERELFDDVSGERLATLSSTSFCRGNGGFGGSTGPIKPSHVLPDRTPDAILEWPTLRQAALVYRLSGDLNPLHADPAYAQRAGFEQPILHGLATFGLAAWAATLSFADGAPDAIASINARFSAPVIPGEAIRFELWRDGAVVSLRAWSKGQKVLDNGQVMLR